MQVVYEKVFLGESRLQEQVKTISYLKIIVACRLWTRKYFLV
jgi:hypothetical protein